MTDIKVLQINLDRCRAAHALLEQTIKELEIDIVLMSEPNKAIATNKKLSWFLDDRIDAAVQIVNQSLKVLYL